MLKSTLEEFLRVIKSLSRGDSRESSRGQSKESSIDSSRESSNKGLKRELKRA